MVARRDRHSLLRKILVLCSPGRLPSIPSLSLAHQPLSSPGPDDPNLPQGFAAVWIRAANAPASSVSGMGEGRGEKEASRRDYSAWHYCLGVCVCRRHLNRTQVCYAGREGGVFQ